MFFKKTFKSKLNRPLAPNVFRIPGTFAGISRIQRYPACVLKLKKNSFCFLFFLYKTNYEETARDLRNT